MLSALDFANRALEREHWARARLAAHAGRTVRLEIGPASLSFSMDAHGHLHESDLAPDLKLTIPALQCPALLAQPERWNEFVTTEGDPGLVATLRELALTVPWFVEDLLARALGPVAGQGLADFGRHLLFFPGYAAQRFGESFKSYLGDEAQLAVGVAEAGMMAGEIAALAARVDALASRIEALARTPERA